MKEDRDEKRGGRSPDLRGRVRKRFLKASTELNIEEMKNPTKTLGNVHSGRENSCKVKGVGVHPIRKSLPSIPNRTGV